ncbi:hypothetical protein, partial [Anaerolinea sp.]|uniref:hypothetical protein n=1 Tax=Anaerolinea sp. TaxID=1872519 RepID=UPI002ACD53E6
MDVLKSTGIVTIGIDIGQKRDPTAVCVAEVLEQITTPDPLRPWEEPTTTTLYVVRFLERLPLGLPYPRVADRLVQIAEGVRYKMPEADIRLYVDQTGVGAPVIDLLRERTQLPLVGVTLAAGERLSIHGREARLGKAFLVSRLQVLLQNVQIRLPKTAEAEQLARELLDFEIKVDQDGQDRYGAFKVGSHDDMVIALGLATLYDPS